MLVSFSIENFSSFAEEQTFTMLATSRAINHKSNLIRTSNSKFNILNATAIYGPNASGKSNFVSALYFMKSFILSDHIKITTEYRPFMLDKKLKSNPTTFDIIFYKNDNFYRYGFTFDSKKVHEEWLYREDPSGKDENPIFFRNDKTVEPNGKIGDDRAHKYATDIFQKRDELFLTNLNNEIRENLSPDIENVLDWFRRLTLLTPQSDVNLFTALDILNEENKKGYFDKIISETDLDIESLKESEVETESDKQYFSRHAGPGTFAFQRVVEKNNRKVIQEIYAETKDRLNKRIKMPIGCLSDGTKRMICLAPLFTLKGDYVIVIDELERSLHPELFAGFIQRFIGTYRNKNVQLIFTTHDSLLMDKNILRTDQFCIFEKENHATVLKPIHGFKFKKPRKDLALGKAYREDRFGGNPNLKNFICK